MTREQLDAIRARVEAATPGPWEAVTPKRYAAVRSDADRCYVYTQGKIPADTHPDTVARQQRDAQFIAAARQDVPALLAEVERLKNELAMAVQVAGELCEKCGWAMRFPGEKCRCELLAEVERLTAERDAAFQRGVAAMREAAAQHLEYLRGGGMLEIRYLRLASEIRALPDPEDTP